MQFLDHLLKNLIVRDLIFLFGGSIFLVALIDSTQIFPMEIETISGLRIFLFLGFAYIIGYVIQEVTAIFPITTTKIPLKYGGFIVWLHNKIHRIDKENNNDANQLTSEYKFDNNKLNSAKNFIELEKNNEHLRLERERIILFKNLGMTIGPSLIYTSFIYFFSICFYSSNKLVLAISLMILGIVLIFLAWIKTIRLAMFLTRVYDSMDQNETEKYKLKTKLK